MKLKSPVIKLDFFLPLKAINIIKPILFQYKNIILNH